MFYDAWIDHWITDLLSFETITENTFQEWMWCPERYTEAQLDFMEQKFNERKLRYQEALDRRR